jgi:hypothetical protein
MLVINKFTTLPSQLQNFPHPIRSKQKCVHGGGGGGGGHLKNGFGISINYYYERLDKTVAPQSLGTSSATVNQSAPTSTL